MYWIDGNLFCSSNAAVDLAAFRYLGNEMGR